MTTAISESDLSITLERYFEASPERVFDAWTGEQWCAWLPPAQSTCKIISQTVKPEGGFKVEMTMPDGRVIGVIGRYIEVVPPSKLKMTWTGSYNNHETVLTITFQPERNGTLMTLHQQGFIDPGLQEGYRAGWSGPGGSFDKLAQVLSAAG